MLVTTLGATGMGSMLKIIAGAIDARHARNELKAKQELLHEIERAKISVEWQAAVFGGPGNAYARVTRRIVAVMGMCGLLAITTLSILFPSAEILTFTPPEIVHEWSLMWGIITIPKSAPLVVTITTGHLAVMGLTVYAAIVGFYFTPAGRA